MLWFVYGVYRESISLLVTKPKIVEFWQDFVQFGSNSGSAATSYWVWKIKVYLTNKEADVEGKYAKYTHFIVLLEFSKTVELEYIHRSDKQQPSP